MIKEKQNKISGAIAKTVGSFRASLPVLLGVIMLLGLFKTFVSRQMISSVFTGQWLADTFIGAFVGSISVGGPITSYIIGGELLQDGISLFAVTAFIVAWVTVGWVQLPAEAALLGKRFALVRNALSFLFAVIISIATVLVLGVIG